MKLYNLIYSSDRSSLCDQLELQKILTESQINNKKSNISGVLLYSETKFVQYLEGGIEDVLNVYERVKFDKRHTNLKLVWGGFAQERMFPNWAMGSLYKKSIDFQFDKSTPERDKAVFLHYFNDPKTKKLNRPIQLLYKLMDRKPYASAAPNMAKFV